MASRSRPLRRSSSVMGRFTPLPVAKPPAAFGKAPGTPGLITGVLPATQPLVTVNGGSGSVMTSPAAPALLPLVVSAFVSPPGAVLLLLWTEGGKEVDTMVGTRCPDDARLLRGCIASASSTGFSKDG